MSRWAALAAAVAALAGPAAAHPQDEIVQGAYLTLAPGAVRLELEIAVGPLVAGPVVRALDRNGDSRISAAEAQAYAAKVLAQSTLTVDGTPRPLRLERIEAPPYGDAQTAASPIRIYAMARRQPGDGAHTLVYRNDYSPAQSRCFGEVFLAPGERWRDQVDGQAHSPDGRRLTVRYTSRTS